MHQIREITFPNFAQKKMYRRHIHAEEVKEAVFTGKMEKKKKGDKILIRSQTLAGRYLLIVTVPIGKHEVMLVSVRDMNEREKSNYRNRMK